MRKKILFIYDSMMIGGTTTALLSLLNSIDKNLYEIDLLLYTNTGALLDLIPQNVHLLEQAYKDNEIVSNRTRKILRTVFNLKLFEAILSFVKYYKTPKGKFRNILMHYGMYAQVDLSRKVNKEYDYAIGFMEGWANQYVVSNKIKSKKKFVWIHPQYKNCYLIPEIDRKIFSIADSIVLISDDCKEQFLDFFPDFEYKLRTIPNIVSSEMIRKRSVEEVVNIQKKAMNICTVCRCDIYVKGLDRLLEVFSKIKQEGYGRDICWHFIGGGSELDVFKNKISELGLDNMVIIYGNKLNPLPYVKEMDIFLLASRYEGKPLSVTEALILGLPCIVTNYESATSQVDNLKTGLIMENTNESIYKTIKYVIENPSLISEWKKNVSLKEYGNEEDLSYFYNLLD